MVQCSFRMSSRPRAKTLSLLTSCTQPQFQPCSRPITLVWRELSHGTLINGPQALLCPMRSLLSSVSSLLPHLNVSQFTPSCHHHGELWGPLRHAGRYCAGPLTTCCQPVALDNPSFVTSLLIVSLLRPVVSERKRGEKRREQK